MKPKRKARRIMSDKKEYLTFEFEPLDGSFFPDLDVDFIVNGWPWKNYGAQYDGHRWKVTLYAVPAGSEIEIVKAGTKERINARRVNDNEVT